MIEQLGLEGYGIYWVLIEILRDQPEYRYPLSLIPAIARKYNTTAEKVKTVVMSYQLFGVENDEFFYSDSLDLRMSQVNSKRQKATAAINSRWHKQELLTEDTNVIRTYYDSNTRKGKERKEKDIADAPRNIFLKPTVDEIREYCTERKNHIDPEHFFDWNESKGWMIGKNKMKDWKAAIRTWEARDKESKPVASSTKQTGAGSWKIT